MLKAFVFSSLLFNTATFILNVESFKKIPAAYANAITYALSPRVHGKVVKYHSATQLCKMHRILPFALAIRKLRLAYFARFLNSAPECLLRLVALEFDHAGELSFIACIIGDLSWVWPLAIDTPLFDLGDPAVCAIQWVQFIRCFPAKFKSVCVKILNNANDGVSFAAGVSRPVAPVVVAPSVPVDIADLTCTVCGKVTKSVASLHGHMSSVHKKRNIVRDVIDSTSCLACLHEFHTRHRMVVHLAYNAPECRHWYFVNIHPLDSETVASLDKQEQLDCKELKAAGHGPRFSAFPSARIAGPKPFNCFYGPQ